MHGYFHELFFSQSSPEHVQAGRDFDIKQTDIPCVDHSGWRFPPNQIITLGEDQTFISKLYFKDSKGRAKVAHYEQFRFI